ncbi:SRPBCC family protein [Leifsonia sp. fls2-241-R2A-40a]|uniref:SRPBCC family protein n=1 Tax=Leifsonia sp. fls2-241-R2A-40a TaxID=3040290 RepID=UPI00254E8E29|nr:SRPBCC family protein [Leifsonia sp. fls2-241-R2A-40a]
MRRITNTIDIDAPAHEVYLALRAVDEYPAWLHHSMVYRGTRGRVAGYEDTTMVGRMPGQVVEEVPDRALRFHQAKRSGSIDADIRYDLDGTGPVTHVTRVGELTTHGFFRATQPMLVWMAAAESRRTMRALKSHVEHPA